MMSKNESEFHAGVRVEADLARLSERSAAAAVALARLRRAIDAAAPIYDRIAVAAMRAAAIMAGELSDWRFVLERCRARARRPALGLRKKWSVTRKRNSPFLCQRNKIIVALRHRP
jgi:hypothetical protein